MKDPKCPICGGKHYKFQCWRNPKTTPKAKYVLKRNISPKLATFSPKTHKVSKKPKNARKSLINALDKVFSEIVRKRAANDKGIAYCYTCGKQDHWKNMDCGHFMKRGYYPTRWDLANARSQCRTCNRYLNGNYEVYRKKMIKELGQDKVDELERKAKSGQKMSIGELESLLETLEMEISHKSK